MSITSQTSRSIIRRSALVLSFTIPGLFLNLLLIYLAAEELSAEAFGVFYVSISIVNILVAPSLILSLYYARHFVAVSLADGPDHAIAAFKLCVRRILRWGTLVAVLVLLLLSGIGYLTGITAFGVVGLIVLIAHGAYVADAVRTALQSLQRFAAFGVYGFVWMALRFLLGGGAILMVGTVWAGLSGIFLAGLAVFGAGYWLLVRRLHPTAEVHMAEDPPLGAVPAFALSYGLLIAIVYLDIMLGYLFLDHAALSVYSASSVLPKGIVVATMPIVQVFFTTFLFSRREVVPLKWALVAKGFALTTLLAGAAIAVLILVPEPLCGGRYGIGFCDADAMAVIALSTLPLCILRVLVLTQLARGREWHPLLLAPPTGLFVRYVALRHLDVADLALAFTVFSYGLLIFYALVSNPVQMIRRYRAAGGRLADDGVSPLSDR